MSISRINNHIISREAHVNVANYDPLRISNGGPYWEHDTSGTAYIEVNMGAMYIITGCKLQGECSIYKVIPVIIIH